MGGISTIRLPPVALEWVEFKQCTEGITSLQAKLCCLLKVRILAQKLRPLLSMHTGRTPQSTVGVCTVELEYQGIDATIHRDASNPFS